MDADPNREQIGPRADPLERLGRQRHGVARVADPDHHAVAHRLDLTSAVVTAERAHGASELASQIRGCGIAGGLRQGRVADEVGEQEGGGGAPPAGAL